MNIRGQDHLHAVPDPMERYWEGFNRWLQGFEISNHVTRLELGTKRLITEARLAGNEEAAKCLETALAALADAKDELRR